MADDIIALLRRAASANRGDAFGAGNLELAAAQEIERLRGALEKIAKAWPCGTDEDMRRVAREALPTTDHT